MEPKFVQRDSKYRIDLLFFASSIGILLLFLLLYQTGVPQIIQDISRGLIHRTLLLNTLLLLGAVYGVLIRYGGMRALDLGMDINKLPPAAILGALIWVFVQLIQGLVGYITNGTITIDPTWNTDATSNIGLFIGMLFGTALYEEIGFRGYLLTQFINKLNKPWSKVYTISLALIISQALFTLLHIPWMIMNRGWTTAIIPDLLFSVFMNGIIYGLFYLRTKNLFFVIIVHALGNAPIGLIEAPIDPSSITLLLAIICYIAWPFIKQIIQHRTVGY
jgi:membrane protease YdiL (CAAX protease family)